MCVMVIFSIPPLIPKKCVFCLKNIKISILGKEKNLILYEENLSNSYLGWNVTNKFWVDEDNFVWRSEQFISPKLPKVIIEVTKKPS